MPFRPSRTASGFRPGSRGFTLVEVLVSMGTIALLMGLAAPTLAGAREAARDTGCRAILRSLALAQGVYALDNQEYIASSVTSGAGGWIKPGLDGFHDMHGNTTGGTPVQVYDWISPLFGDSLPVNRAERMRTILDRFACPANGVQNAELYIKGIRPPDMHEFEDIAKTGPGFRGVSYLAPHALYALSGEASVFRSTGLKRLEFIRKYPGGIAKSFSSPVLVPPRYRPRLDRMGTRLSHKAVAFDGTRFVSKSLGVDFDIRQRPRYFGAFTDSGPATDLTAGYGRRPSNRDVDTERNLELSLRHGGAMNLAYFDGRVDQRSEAEVRSDLEPFFPGGSRWVGGAAATPEAEAVYAPGERIP